LSIATNVYWQSQRSSNRTNECTLWIEFWNRKKLQAKRILNTLSLSTRQPGSVFKKLVLLTAGYQVFFYEIFTVCLGYHGEFVHYKTYNLRGTSIRNRNFFSKPPKVQFLIILKFQTNCTENHSVSVLSLATIQYI